MSVETGEGSEQGRRPVGLGRGVPDSKPGGGAWGRGSGTAVHRVGRVQSTVPVPGACISLTACDSMPSVISQSPLRRRCLELLTDLGAVHLNIFLIICVCFRINFSNLLILALLIRCCLCYKYFLCRLFFDSVSVVF